MRVVFVDECQSPAAIEHWVEGLIGKEIVRIVTHDLVGKPAQYLRKGYVVDIERLDVSQLSLPIDPMLGHDQWFLCVATCVVEVYATERIEP